SAGAAARPAKVRYFPVSPWGRCPRRRTGGKIAGGAACDVVCTLVAVEAAGQPDAGSRLPKGPFIVASSTRVSFFPLAPGSPGGTSLQGQQLVKGGRRVQEVSDEPLYRDRACGIDIGKAGMVATIRVPSDKNPARRAAETRSFGTTKREVLALADWLRSWQVPAVVMEATSDYWK